MSEPDVEMNYDDELDFGLDGLFEDEPPAEEAVLAPAAAAAEPAEPEQPEPLVPVLALRALARAKQSQSKKKGKVNSRGRLLAKLQRKLAARRAVAADAAEQVADIARSEDLNLDAEQVEPDLVEFDADADANERVGLDRHAPARFVAGSRHANVTTTPLLHPTGVTGTGPINAGADGAISIEEYRTLLLHD